MSAPADLSKLRINRDAPGGNAPVRRALARNLILFVVAVAVVVVTLMVVRARSIPTVQVVTASATTAGGSQGGGAGGATAVTANGYVVARTKASVSAKIPGRLAALNVSEGSFVRRGEVIAQLDNADYQAAVAEAQANLASSDASIIEARADDVQLARDAARSRNIRQTDPRLMSSQEVELAQSKADQGEARLNAAVARRNAADAAVKMADANYENTFIRAPFTGTVLHKDAELGEVVAPSVGGGLTRGAVVTMADLSTLEVEVDVNEAYIGRIQTGAPARITLDAYPDTTFRGSVRQIVPTADRERATVQVKVAINDHDSRILPEMGAKVDFLNLPTPDSSRATNAVVSSRPVIRIPSSTIKTDGGASVVYIVRDGRLVRRPVTTGPVSGGYVEVRSGLSGGEQLLVSGVETPTDHMQVKVQ